MKGFSDDKKEEDMKREEIILVSILVLTLVLISGCIIPTKRVCTNDYDCHLGWKCVNGFCELPSVTPSCTNCFCTESELRTFANSLSGSQGQKFGVLSSSCQNYIGDITPLGTDWISDRPISGVSGDTKILCDYNSVRLFWVEIDTNGVVGNVYFNSGTGLCFRK